MQNKQLPLIFILLLMALVACGGNGAADSEQTDPLDLPLVATADGDAETADTEMEEASSEDAMADEDADEASEEMAEASPDEADDAEGEMAEDADAEAMDEDADMASDSAENEAASEDASMDDEDADAMDEESADAEAADADDADADAAEEGDDAAMEESSDEAMTEDLSGTTVYVVQSGDSLSEIAETFAVDPTALMAANNIENANQIFAGQPLVIPAEGDSAETAGDDAEATAEEGESAPAISEGEYTVQAGDTLSELAEALEIPARAIAAKNGISDQDGLFTGQVLQIPVEDEIEALLEAPLPEPSNVPGTYVVQPGDSLAGIAIAFGVSQAELAAANGIVDFDTVYVGQTLVIP